MKLKEGKKKETFIFSFLPVFFCLLSFFEKEKCPSDFFEKKNIHNDENTSRENIQPKRERERE